MPQEAFPGDCGAIVLGCWPRDNSPLSTQNRKEIDNAVEHVNQRWTTHIIATVLGSQTEVRKYLQKKGFYKTKDIPNKYRQDTICIYYYNGVPKPKRSLKKTA